MGLGYIPELKQERKSISAIINELGRSVNTIWDHLNVEVKQNDTHQTVATIADTATFYELTDINAGISGTTGGGIDVGYRDGNKIRMKSINVKAKINRHGSNTTDVNYIGVYLIKHYDNFLGNSLSYDDIYDQYTGTNFYLRLRNNNHKGQYKILQSRLVKLCEVDDNNSIEHINMYLSFKGKRSGTHVEWEGGDGLDPSNGKYYLCVISDQTTFQPTIIYSSRVTYIDN